MQFYSSTENYLIVESTAVLIQQASIWGDLRVKKIVNSWPLKKSIYLSA